jgi:hypothetical protein
MVAGVSPMVMGWMSRPVVVACKCQREEAMARDAMIARNGFSRRFSM